MGRRRVHEFRARARARRRRRAWDTYVAAQMLAEGWTRVAVSPTRGEAWPRTSWWVRYTPVAAMEVTHGR